MEIAQGAEEEGGRVLENKKGGMINRRENLPREPENKGTRVLSRLGG